MDISQLLTDWFTSEKSEVEPSFLAYVLLYSTKNVAGLEDIIKQLSVFWDKGDQKCKSKCVELLTQVITPSQESLDRSKINVVIQFVGKALTGLNVATRCIDILSVLMNTSDISSTDVIQICEVIFNNVKTKKVAQQTRYKILIILGKSLQKYASEIQRSKINFISGFINCMDGEKDPRNLMVAFELVREIIDRFDISSHIEDLFEIVFCYFPISFVAPSNDPFGITTDDLKDSLRRCLAATPYFAYYATPLLIEKLLSTTGSAKKDAMETISLCAPAYGAHAILPHAPDLFDALVKEVYQEANSAMVHVALQTIHNVVATLGTGISIANIRDPVEKAIDGLLQKCVEELKEPELKNARSAAYVLRAAASASDPACTSVTHTALPIIYQQYKTSDPPIRRKAVLDILTELLIASKKLYGSVEDVGYDRDFQTPLLMYKQQILQVFVLSLIESGPDDVVLRQASLKGIHEMVLMKQFLNAEERSITVDHLTRQLMRENKDLRQIALSTLGVIAKLYPSILGQRTFPILLKELASLDTPTISSTYQDALEAIQILGANPPIFKIIINLLLEKLDYACGSIGKQNITYVHDIATTILKIYKAASKDCETVLLGQKTLMPTLLLKCVQSTTGSGYWYLDDTLIETFAMIAAITTRLSSPSEQQLFVDDAFKLFVQGDFSVVDQQLKQSDIFTIFSEMKEVGSVDITLLFTAIIGNCKKDVKLPLPSLPFFLQEMIETAIGTTSETKKLALSKAAASIINKWSRDEIVKCIQKVCSEKILPVLQDPAQEKKTVFSILIWIIKAFIIRGHRYGFELLDSIIKLCGTTDMGQVAAESFVVLLQQDELVLNKASHATVSILYKQRVFNYCFATLRNGYESIDVRQPELQVNYLLALIHVLQNIPSQITVNEILKLMSPIIVALSSKDDTLIESTLSVAQEIIPNAQDLVIQHLGSFIHALLRLTQYPSANIRILALNCLNDIATKGKYDHLSPFKPSVVKELSIALDDKKRIVRKNAVDCREKWYALGK